MNLEGLTIEADPGAGRVPGPETPPRPAGSNGEAPAAGAPLGRDVRLLTPAVERVVEWHRRRAEARAQTARMSARQAPPAQRAVPPKRTPDPDELAESQAGEEDPGVALGELPQLQPQPQPLRPRDPTSPPVPDTRVRRPPVPSR